MLPEKRVGAHDRLSPKFDHAGWLGLAEREGLALGEPHLVHPGRDILGEGAFVSHPSLLLAGMACRYKMLGDGRRAIVAFLIPGDFAGPCFLQDHKTDFGVAALTVCEVADIPRLPDRALSGGSPGLARALLRLDQLDRAIQRMWLANIGQPADKRLAHLLCELHERLALVGMADENSFPLLMTQQDLADALGLSSVHVNRVVQYLREEGFIRTANRNVYIPDPARLHKFAGFDSAYLRLGRAS